MSYLIHKISRILSLDPKNPEGRAGILEDCSILLKGKKIQKIGVIEPADHPEATLIDGQGLTAIPGLVQTHIHLCQTAFRNTADDLELLDWLSHHLWPGEAGLNHRRLKISAQMGIAELLLGGTTSIMDMATIRHTGAVFEALAESGLRAISGKCLMDDTEICPPELVEDTRTAYTETREIIEKWHGYDEGRLQVAITPRFAVSCTHELMKQCVELSHEYGLIIHTHASENRGEIELVRKKTGYGNLEYFEQIGLLSERACLAHCVHLEAGDLERLAKYNVRVLHCPSSNLKLASGIAPVQDMLEAGISVSLGADGAGCNNNLDAFMEMRLAGLIHKPRYGARAMPAPLVFLMATAGGAHALGLEKTTGHIKEGFLGDITLLDLNGVHSLPNEDPFSALVYAARASDVKHVFVDGKLLLKDRKLTYGNIEDWRGEFLEIHKYTEKKLNG